MSRLMTFTGYVMWGVWALIMLVGCLVWLRVRYVKWRNRRMVKRVHRAQIKRTIRELCTHPIRASSDEEAIRLLTEM